MAPKYDFNVNPSIIVISVSVLLYGIYLTLFMKAIYLLSRKREAQAHRNFYIVILVALFLFATAAVIVDIIGFATANTIAFELFDGTMTAVEQSNRKILFLNILEEVVLLMYSLANVAADTVLIFRLYVLWGCVMVVPAIIAVLNNILAILNAAIRLTVALIVDGQSTPNSDMAWTTAMTLSFMIANLVVNTLVTGLIARRMVSSSYRQKGTQQNYRRVVAITLESGVLYPVVIFVVLVVGQLIPTTPNLFAILAEVVAIALVPIIMRLTLGDNINDERTSTHNPELVESDIRRAEEGSMNSRERPSTFEGGDTSTVEDNDTTYHPAQSNMSLAPFSNTTSPRSTIVPNSIIVQVPPGVDINNEQTTVYSPGNARSRTRRAERGGTLQERFSVLSGGHTSTNYDSAQSYMSSPPRSNATSPHPTLREQAPSPLMR